MLQREETDQIELGKEWVKNKRDPDWFEVKPVNGTVGKKFIGVRLRAFISKQSLFVK